MWKEKRRSEDDARSRVDDDDREADIRELKLKIENLLVAADFPQPRQEATIAYLKELQFLRQRLHDLVVTRIYSYGPHKPTSRPLWCTSTNQLSKFLPTLPGIYALRRPSRLSLRA